MTPPFHHTAIWYDRHTRSWVVQLLDDRNNQIGDADFVATKGEAQAYEVAHWIKRYKAAYKATALREFEGYIIYERGWFKMTGYRNVRKSVFIRMVNRLEARVK